MKVVSNSSILIALSRIEQLNLLSQRFEEGIKNIQSLLINKFDYIRSTVINRPSSSNSGVSF